MGFWCCGREDQSATVTPEDHSLYLAKRTPASWARKHPLVTLLLALLVLVCTVAIIVVPTVCATVGCGHKEEKPDTSYRDGAPIRLIVELLGDKKVQDALPPILQKYYVAAQLALSSLQIVEAVTEEILQVIEDELRKRTDLVFLIRDFSLKAPVDLDLAASLGSHRLRKLFQDYNDAQMGQQWYLSKIKATDAWTTANEGVADVIIGVTDSGAMLTHPDLVGQFWVNPGEGSVPNGIDDDGNGIIDDINGAIFSTPSCSFSSLNRTKCGSPNDTVGHGTRIAGVIAAANNNSIGISGVAPGVKVMVLKVTDETVNPTNPPYPYSDVVRAVDYAVSNGARIISMSFGDDGRNSLQNQFKSQLDQAAAAYTKLFAKYAPYGVLFVAASGNEWTNLDNWKAVNFTYSPCMITAPNLLCVGATDENDAMVYALVANRDTGTNFGLNTVDMAAPGARILSTSLGGTYAVASGTSYAAPMVAAAAGMVAGVLGLQADGNYSGSLAKDILMSSGDALVGLQVKSGRRLNLVNAMTSAIEQSKSRVSMTRFAGPNAIKTTVLSRTFTETYYQDTRKDGQFETLLMPVVDVVTRDVRTTKFSGWKYSSGYLVVIKGYMRLLRSGLWSVQTIATNADPGSFQLVIGERNLNAQNLSSNPRLQNQLVVGGYFAFELWIYPRSTTTIDIKFTTPTSSSFAYLNDTFYQYSDDVSLSYNSNPQATPLPSIYHVVYNETNSTAFAKNFFYGQSLKDIRQYSTVLPDLNMLNVSSVTNALFPNGTNATGVFGVARTTLKAATYGTYGVAFQVFCTQCRLFVNNLQVLDQLSDSVIVRQSGCMSLANGVALDLMLQFAVKLGTGTTSPLSLTWTPCKDRVPPTATSAYTSLTPSLAHPFFWQPSGNMSQYPTGIKCNAWVHNDSWVNGVKPAFNLRSNMSFLLPRDCPATYAGVFPVPGECRMSFFLRDFTPAPTNTSTPYFVRCWTYWSGGFKNGIVRHAGAASPAEVYMAGQMAYYGAGDSVTSITYAATNVSMPNGTYALVVAEWISRSNNWKSGTRLALMNGNLTVDSSGPDVWYTDSDSMLLPLGTT